MARYAVNTRVKPEVVIEKALHYFGNELNMDITEQHDCCVRFTGGNGFVHFYIIADHGVKEITIETQAWDEQVEKFLIHL